MIWSAFNFISLLFVASLAVLSPSEVVVRAFAAFPTSFGCIPGLFVFLLCGMASSFMLESGNLLDVGNNAFLLLAGTKIGEDGGLGWCTEDGMATVGA